jgi:hypothetical protein
MKHAKMGFDSNNVFHFTITILERSTNFVGVVTILAIALPKLTEGNGGKAELTYRIIGQFGNSQTL